MLATSLYSFLLNLYLSVVKNFGFTSSTNDLTSSTAFLINSSFSPVVFSSSLFHKLAFLMFFVAKIRLAAASSLGL